MKLDQRKAKIFPLGQLNSTIQSEAKLAETEFPNFEMKGDYSEFPFFF